MAALAGALRQELPDVTDSRAEFLIDDLPYVFTTEASSPAIFAYSVIGALPGGEAEQARVFAGLLHAQFCFSDSGPFSFGVDAENSFVLLQALVDTERVDESAFVALMDQFVKTANVWSKRLLAESDGAEAAGEEPEGEAALQDEGGAFQDFDTLRV